MRFNHADERTATMIEAEVAVVNALAAKGVRVAKPRRSLAGNDVESVETDVYPFVADIALALSDLFGDNPEQVDFQQETFLPFINGYRTARSLPEEELPFIPLFLRVQNLFTYARLQRALTPVDPAGEPPWMAGLRAKLATKMAVSRKGFVV